MSDLQVPLLAPGAIGLEDEEKSTAPRPLPTKAQKARQITFGQLTCIAFLLVVVFPVTVLLKSQLGPLPSRDSSADRDSVPACPCTDAPSVVAPRQNVWRNLDVQEAADVRRWLMAPERGLNLKRIDQAATNDSYIHYVEAYKPAKNLTLAYFEDKTKTFAKYAHAVVHDAGRGQVIDYLVGPLPVSKQTRLAPLTHYHNPAPLNAAMAMNFTAIGQAMQMLLGPLEDATVDLFNGSIKDKTLLAAGVGPMSYDGSWRRSWLELRRNLPGFWLRPVDMYIYVDMTGTDVSKFRVLRLMHNNVVYDSIEAFLAAWQRGECVRALPDLSDWSSRAVRGKVRDLDDRAGPRRVLVDGARFRVDREQDYITWMDWSFYLSFERDMGLHLWNIDFKGDRIIYELSPQEAMAQYSGSDPHQATTVWLDRAFGMGGTVRELMLNYDCPADALLLNATVHEAGSSTRKNAICVFENEKHIPLSRHTEAGHKNVMGAVKGYELVVRSISSVGNYDYIFDYTFQLDGTIEIRLSASGYLQGGAWNENEAPYGHRIHHNSMGSLHDHVINYKVDFDILGVKNSMMKVGLEVEHVQAPWTDDDWGNTVVQQKIVRTPLKEESLLEYAPNMQGAYVVTSDAHRNRWGNPRGYVIHPGPLCRLTNLESKRTEKNVNWAKQHLAVSRRKEDEPSSSSTWNMNLPGAPPVDFYKFFNNESIEDEDLVVWLNLGTHHIPRAEDSPNTLTNLATSYVLLAPWNFFDHDVSIESRNSILLNGDGKQAWAAEESVRVPQCRPTVAEAPEYHGIYGWDEDGQLLSPDNAAFLAYHSEPNSGMRPYH